MVESITFSGDTPASYRRFGTEYAVSQVGTIVDYFDSVGLAPEYLAVLSRHVADLELVIEDPGKHGSTLSVASRREDGERTWHRNAVLSRFDLSDKKRFLESLMESMGIKPETSVNSAVLGWGFYELVGDALGNSVSMQDRYNKYIPDWNGQAYCYLGQYAISEWLFGEYAQNHGELNDKEYAELQLAIRRDHAGLRSGVALGLVRDSLLRDVTDNVTQTNWIIQGIKELYYKPQNIFPLSKHQLMARLALMSPKEHPVSMEEFFNRYIDDPGPDS